MLVASMGFSFTGLVSEPKGGGDGRGASLAVLVERMSRGEQEALAGLYDATAAALNGLLVRMLGRSEDAEEVLMDVYMRAWKRASSFSASRGSVLSWLLMMARSMAIDRIRQRKGYADAPGFDLEELELLVSGDPSPEAITEDNWRRKRVADVLRSLPQEQKEVLELAFFLGLTHAELAEKLGQPLGTIKSRIRAALMRLRSLLEQEVTA